MLLKKLYSIRINHPGEKRLYTHDIVISEKTRPKTSTTKQESTQSVSNSSYSIPIGA